MSAKNIAAHIAGLVAVLAALGWGYLDLRADGHLERMTAIGCAALLSAGWFLIDKQSLSDFAAFGWAQFQRFKNGGAAS